MDMDDYDKECFDRIQRIAELEAELSMRCVEEWRLNAEVERMENLLAEGIHTCNPTCKRPLCVLRREKRELEAELQTAHEIGARHAKRVGEQALELQALRDDVVKAYDAIYEGYTTKAVSILSKHYRAALEGGDE
jgi:hypothetical protein